MSDAGSDEEPFVSEVRRQAERLHQGKRITFWQGVGLVGGVGWMVSLPMVLGALVGHWLDSWLGTGIACTLGLLGLGLVLGCASAWRHVQRELKR